MKGGSIMARVNVEQNIAYDDQRKAYYVTMDFGKDETGKRNKQTKSFKKLSEARKALKEFEANKTRGELIMPKKITLEEWLNYWLEEIVKIKSAETTYYAYGQIIKNHLVPNLGKINLQDLKAAQVQRYLNWVAKEHNLSSVTVKKHHTLLKTALSFAVKQEYLLHNIIEKVEAPKVQKTDIDCYSREEMLKLFEYVKGDRIELFVKLAGYLGLRRGEYCGLKWNSIDFDKRVITIKYTRTSAGSKIIEKDTKNNSSIRKLPLPEELYDLLQFQKYQQEENKKFFGSQYFESDYVLVNKDGIPTRPNRLSEMFKKFLEDNNLPLITLHGLRHSFASNANLCGATAFDISKALGHSNTSTTTKVYMHMFDTVHEGTVSKVVEMYTNKEQNENK